jgi:hypothetical protein
MKFKVGDIIKLKIRDCDYLALVAAKNIFRAKIMSIYITEASGKYIYDCLVTQANTRFHLPVGEMFKIFGRENIEARFLIDNEYEEEML